MASSVVLLVCLWWGFCFSQQQKRVGATTTFTNEEDAIKTISTKYGDIYDCVDFYKQPAFDHPLLKTHDFHPHINPMMIYPNNNNTTKDSPQFGNIWQNGKGCPTGTVPIRRTTQEHLVNVTLATQIFSRKYDLLTDAEVGTHYAVLHTNNGAVLKFNGAGMEQSSWNPRVSGAQYSAGYLKLANGAESIEAGWIVNPSLYGDAKTHFFIYTHMGTSHCFNLFCSGFVSTRPDMPVDHVVPTSTRGTHRILAQTSLIYRDPQNSKWVLAIGNEQTTTEIGFWPERIFTRLHDSATYVEWGGKVYSPSNVPSPSMGAGEMLKGNMEDDAFCRQLVVVNKSFKTISAAGTSSYADIIYPNYYQLIDRGYFIEPNGHLMYYGGPGGYRGN